MTISSEKCLEMAGLPTSTEMPVRVTPEYIQALINRAFAEGQRDMRERAVECCYIAKGRDGDAIEEAITNLEIE